MYFRRHSNNLISGALAIAIAIFMISTFGEKLMFDTAAPIAYLFCAYLFKEDKNIMGVCVVLAVVQILINFIFIFSVDNYLTRIIFYLLTALVLSIFRSDKQFGIVTAVLILSLISEFYWYFTGYHGPEIYFSFAKISVYMVAKFALTYRAHGLSIYLKEKSTAIRLDWIVLKVLSVGILIEIVYLAEYLIRHNTDLNPILMYQLYPYVAHAISAYYMWLILDHAISLLRARTLSA